MSKRKSRPTFEQAKAMYVHRFTMEHVPAWSQHSYVQEGRTKYYAPQYRYDTEWYANTLFPGEENHYGGSRVCNSNNQSWPLGMWLDAPYTKE